MCVCILALVIQHVSQIFLRHIFPSVASLAFPYFSTLSHKRHDLWKKINPKCLFWFSLQILSETFLIIRRIQRVIITNVHMYSHKVPVTFVRFEWNLNFLNRFLTNPQISSSINICPVGAELFNADRQVQQS